MKKPLVDQIPFARIVVVLSAAFCIGLGLCGIEIFLASHDIWRSNEEFGFTFLDGPSLLLMILSIIGLAVTGLLWFVAAILSPRGSNDPQRLFNDDDKNQSSS